MREWVESSLLTLKQVSEPHPRTQKERGSGSETTLKHTPFGVNKLSPTRVRQKRVTTLVHFTCNHNILGEYGHMLVPNKNSC